MRSTVRDARRSSRALPALALALWALALAPGLRAESVVLKLAKNAARWSADRLALALVLTHDGNVLYTLPDRVMSCAFGQRVQCRWVYAQ